MKNHLVRTYKSSEPLPREEQLAWKIAEVAVDPVEVSAEVTDMVINRVIDNASVAVASLGRAPVTSARGQALAHQPTPGGSGASVFGVASKHSPEWAAWANGVAVRELDYHDTYLAEEYSHPGDNIPPVLAVAQHVGSDGAALVRGLATGYEIQIDLATGMSLHRHKIDHVAHLGPSAAAGIGTLLGLAPETIYQAIGQALHTTTATRQSRKGEISTWKAHAPAFAGKMAVEAIDRALRGQTSSSRGCSAAPRRVTRSRCRRPGRPSGPSSTRTRRSTRPSTRPRPGSTWLVVSAPSAPSCATPPTSPGSCSPPATTRTT